MEWFHKEGFGVICEGDVVFRSCLKDREWRLENSRHLHPSWPVIVQRF